MPSPAEVAELADALDSKSSGPLARVGSTPTFGISLGGPALQRFQPLDGLRG
jgi:hypothetical protein